MKRFVFSLSLVLLATTIFGQNINNLQEIEVIAPTVKSDLFKYQDTPDGHNAFAFYINDIIIGQADQMEFRNGKVVIDFVVHEDGSLSDYKVVNSVSNANDKSVMTALNSTSGHWNPGQSNGNALAMEKRIVVNFIDKEKSSLVELAQKYYMKGLKKYYLAEEMQTNYFASDLKNNKKIERALKSAINNFNHATRFYSQDACIVYYELKAYELLGDNLMTLKKEGEYNTLVNETIENNADYMAVNY